MGVLYAFMSVWSQARSTFGQGAPQAGAAYDQSPQLRQLQSGTVSAGPGAHWSGGAATAYAAKNDEHARTFGRLADLDGELAAEIDKSAAVVAQGRQDLGPGGVYDPGQPGGYGTSAGGY